VFFPALRTGDRRIAIRIAPFAYPGAPAQTLALALNGRRLDPVFTLGEGWQIVTTTLPASDLRGGLNMLALQFDHTAVPSAVLPGVADTRRLSAAVDWFEVGAAQ
jgi:hypothetical protein